MRIMIPAAWSFGIQFEDYCKQLCWTVLDHPELHSEYTRNQSQEYPYFGFDVGWGDAFPIFETEAMWKWWRLIYFTFQTQFIRVMLNFTAKQIYILAYTV